jgi:hypothetical protein
VRLWYWSPHFHVWGVIKGGYGCRSCNHERGDCRSCSGFNGREVRGFAKDGYLVKVLPERKTVFGTAFYQLNHATVRLGIKRFHCLTWFGSCAKRMFKSAVVKVQISCPVCEDEMVRCMHMGSRHIVKDIGHADYVAVFVDRGLMRMESLIGFLLLGVELVELVSGNSASLEFKDVVECRDVAEFHLFVRRYFRERAIFNLKEKRSHFWALFYAWRESFLGKVV